SSLDHTVTPASTTTTLSSSDPDPSSYSATLTLTVTVASAVGAPSGNVELHVDGAVAGTAGLSSGTATFMLSALPVGGHTLYAAPPGSMNFSASPSMGLPRTVTKAASTTTLVRSAGMSPADFGQAVTFTATVPADAGGTVQFKDGTTNLGNPVA